jgi:hypothetical protein
MKLRSERHKIARKGFDKKPVVAVSNIGTNPPVGQTS